jgi:hypothetical protein
VVHSCNCGRNIKNFVFSSISSCSGYTKILGTRLLEANSSLYTTLTFFKSPRRLFYKGQNHDKSIQKRTISLRCGLKVQMNTITFSNIKVCNVITTAIEIHDVEKRILRSIIGYMCKRLNMSTKKKFIKNLTIEILQSKNWPNFFPKLRDYIYPIKNNYS